MKKITNLYLRFLKYLIKKGKINKSRRILNETFFSLYRIFKKPVFFLLNTFFFKLNTFIEVRSIRIRRTKYLVPFSIDLNRRLFLVFKWFLLSLKQNNSKRRFSFKMSKEFYDILNNLSCKTLELQKSNNSKALLNRANIHYRW